MVSGIDLKVDRIRAGVQAKQIAGRMAVSRQRITQIEQMPDASRFEARYRAALREVVACRQPASDAA